MNIRRLSRVLATAFALACAPALLWALSLYISFGSLEEALTDASSEISVQAQVEAYLNPKVAVINLVNRDSGKRDATGVLLERRLQALLRQRLPNQVIAAEKLEQARSSWNAEFPGASRNALSEDLAGLVEADWMVTGDYRRREGLVQLRLQAYSFSNQSLVWQGLLEAPEGSLATVGTASQAKDPNPLPSGPAPSTVQTAPFPLPKPPTPSPPGAEASQTLEPAEVVSEDAVPEPGSGIADGPPEAGSAVALAGPTGADPEVAPEGAGVVAEGDPAPAEDTLLETYLQAEQERLGKPEGMVLLPGGEFTMGRDNGRTNEFPDHRVVLSPFWLGQHEVTNAEYERCPNCERGSGGFDSVAPQAPVVYVDWENARRYCAFRGWRLPTEAEWEYAAREGGALEVASLSLLESQAWYENTVPVPAAQPVGALNANALGVHDLLGNVMEWVSDYYAGDYYPVLGKPENPRGPDGPVRADYPLRVARGGAWGGLHQAGTVEGVQPTRRFSFAPWTRSFQIGFRCARDAAPPLR